jgi:ATP/maltotriose-dependent transcriptional regulator MalT
VALCNYVLARVHTRAGAFDDAHELYRAARGFYQEVGVASLEVLVDGLESECLLAEGRAGDAFTMVDGALARARRSGAMATSLPLLLRVRGLALLARGEESEGLADLHACLATARDQKAVHEVAFTLEALLAHDPNAPSALRRQWRSERETLAERLGLRRSPAAGPSPSQAEVA